MEVIRAGTVEWFKKRHRVLVSHARALDSIASARRSIASLLSNWDHSDPEIRSALHTAAVINYARPFTKNVDKDGLPTYTTNRLRRQPGFDARLHKHLCDLRHKLIAHHDSEFLRATVLYDTVNAKLPSGATVALPLVTSVHVMALQLLQNRSIAEQYASHFDAALMCINEGLVRDLGDVMEAAVKWPEVQRAATKNRTSERIDGQLSTGQPYLHPSAQLSALARLPTPTLSVTAEGAYLFRIMSFTLQAEGEIPIPGSDGPILLTVGSADPVK